MGDELFVSVEEAARRSGIGRTLAYSLCRATSLAMVWDWAVAEAGQYRTINLIGGHDHVLGHRPTVMDPDRAGWDIAARTLRQAGQQLGLTERLDTELGLRRSQRRPTSAWASRCKSDPAVAQTAEMASSARGISDFLAHVAAAPTRATPKLIRCRTSRLPDLVRCATEGPSLRGARQCRGS